MAYIAEHDAPDKQAQELQGGEPIPSIVKTCKELLKRAKVGRKRFDQEWSNNYEFVFGGRQWSIDRPAWRFSEVVNATWANIMTEVAIQTDAKPKTDFQAVEPSDFQFAEVLSKINDINWEKYPWLQRIADIVTQCKYVHVSHAEVCWKEDLENGLGDVDFKILDPWYCYWDPLATCIEDARYFIYAVPTCTEKLKNEHPDKAEQIKADMELVGVGNEFGDVVSPTSDRHNLKFKHRAARPEDRFGGEPMTVLLRIWMKDEAVEEYENDKEDGTKEYVVKKKYPRGRYVEIASNCLLKDEENQYEDGEFPIARLVNYSYPGEYAGENEVTHLRGPQRLRNYVYSFILDQMKTSSNPKVIIGEASGVDPDNVSSEPGQKIIATDINQIRFEQGQPIPAGMQFILDESKVAFDQVSGLQDVMKGAVDPAIGSGLLFDGYVEAAQVRLRLKNRNLDQFLTRVGKLQASRYMQYYTVPRVYRITNEQGFPEHIEFFISKLDDGKTMANVRNISLGGATQTMEVKGMPDVKVISGTSLPFMQAMKKKTAQEYFNSGLIDQEEALKSIDWPNWQQVLERMQKAAQEQAQLASQQQAQQGGMK